LNHGIKTASKVPARGIKAISVPWIKPPPGVLVAGPDAGVAAHIQRAGIKQASPHPLGKVRQQNAAQVVTPLIVNTSSANTTGINHWWTYEEDAIGGVGRYMVNVSNGNLIAQADDMAIPNKGIELAFRRTYNSLSTHDYSGSDGSIPSNYGNGWTNTFDAHIAPNSSGGVTVFDIDGARYDYTSNGSGGYIAPAGQFAVLSSSSGYTWTKKSGTVYRFYNPAPPANQAAFAGRLESIKGRNSNNSLSFSYFFDGANSSSSKYLNKIVVTAEDGRTATLLFADAAANRLLQSLAWPDGTQVTYEYDASANLAKVHEPGNNVAASLEQDYVYFTSGLPNSHFLQLVYSPLWVNSAGTNGEYLEMQYAGVANELSAVLNHGFVNPTISDGYSSGPIQPSAASGLSLFRTVNLSYTGSTTQWSDTDGHQTTYTWDSLGRVVQTDNVTGDFSGPAVLTTHQGWSTANNLVTSIDARGNETDYAHDDTGNTTGVGEANVTRGGATFRPTSLYSYDGHNNITAYCDPVEVHASGKDWITKPSTSDTLCSTASGITALFTKYTWTPTTAEPYGELTSTITPMGYTESFSYAPSSQGGSDFGLPTSVTAAGITQNDGSIFTPTQIYSYDRQGNIACYSKGVGTWALAYDQVGRPLKIADPDDGSAFSTSTCGKSSNANTIVTTNAYFANGQLSSSQSPVEAAAGIQTPYTYDADGNETTEIHHFGTNAGGLTKKSYDGKDRLVEVQLPHDSRTWSDGKAYEYYAFPWLTRYFYDLTGNNTVAAQGSPAFYAHGNLFKTQEYLSTWTDAKAAAYDALDRNVVKYAYPAGSCTSRCVAEPETLTYDTNTHAGLLSSDCNALNVCSQPSYDADGKQTGVSFNDSGVTPNRTYAMDADARTVQTASAAFGTESYVFDADGRKTSVVEAGLGAITSPATISYHYYLNGMRSSLDVSASAFSQAQTNFKSYNYEPDGLLKSETFTYNAAPYAFSWSYTAAGRPLTQSDPYTGATDSGLAGPIAPKKYVYDQFGRISEFKLPTLGDYTSFTYDPEGEETGYVAGGYTIANAFNVRGQACKSAC